MDITLSEDRRAAFVGKLQSLFEQDFDENLSDFQAGEVLDLVLKTLGPAVYNQAVQDVRAHLQVKLDDLDGEIYVEDSM
ncbi:MAG: DUF2164 domain-containing protein [Pseudomonadota bacterium]